MSPYTTPIAPSIQRGQGMFVGLGETKQTDVETVGARVAMPITVWGCGCMKILCGLGSTASTAGWRARSSAL